MRIRVLLLCSALLVFGGALLGYEEDTESWGYGETYQRRGLVPIWNAVSADGDTALDWHSSPKWQPRCGSKYVRQHFLFGLHTREHTVLFRHFCFRPPSATPLK
ncbi:hypothetical protein FTUN_7921 [Frigoriglobus tundricola]|uniref:Uncharacterized protein n=1 Tax=Frigoriglobus tundricola TaxID=2774151 RepID=A0A6M5Z2J7_9BACT|nr:hypothetical protein FTUN_7921 [Frigoriglobus tundricola]